MLIPEPITNQEERLLWLAGTRSCAYSGIHWWYQPTFTPRQERSRRDYPGCPVAKTLCSQCRVEGFPWWLSGKESACYFRRFEFDPRVAKIPWRRKWQPTLVFLPGKSHGQRSLQATVHEVAKMLDTTERLNKRVDLKRSHFFKKHFNRLTDLENELMVSGGRMAGRDS